MNEERLAHEERREAMIYLQHCNALLKRQVRKLNKSEAILLESAISSIELVIEGQIE
jgi:hypothetical protein